MTVTEDAQNLLPYTYLYFYSSFSSFTLFNLYVLRLVSLLFLFIHSFYKYLLASLSYLLYCIPVTLSLPLHYYFYVLSRSFLASFTSFFTSCVCFVSLLSLLSLCLLLSFVNLLYCMFFSDSLSFFPRLFLLLFLRSYLYLCSILPRPRPSTAAFCFVAVVQPVRVASF